MSKGKRLIELMLVIFITCLVGMICGASSIYTLYNNEKDKNESLSGKEEINELYNKIVNEYYGDVDEKLLTEAALSGMLSILDSNSSYLDPSSTTSFNNKMKGEYYGIGVEVITVDEEGSLVMSVVENSPAFKAGIKEGDMIISVNGESLKNKTAAYLISFIANTKGSNIKFNVLRNDEELTFNFAAELVVIDSVTSNIYYKNNNRIGYLKISVFAMNTATQFITKLDELESSGIDSLIIDVRDNAGGYLSNASTILELFMKKGTILYKTETKDTVSNRKDSTNNYREYPVAILVNGSSASASEVLTASFMENYDSEVIGSTTYGKGTVQETVNVLGDSMAKITTKKWLTPNGNWINETGIEPTISVPISDAYLKEQNYDNDNQLQRAIEVLNNRR